MHYTEGMHQFMTDFTGLVVAFGGLTASFVSLRKSRAAASTAKEANDTAQKAKSSVDTLFDGAGDAKIHSVLRNDYGITPVNRVAETDNNSTQNVGK